MGCGNCGTVSNGKPMGCKGNGGCSSGGCNRLNVFDWLSDLPLDENMKPYGIVEVAFNRGNRKEFFRNNTQFLFDKGDWVAVEGVGGTDIGQVSLMGELVKLQLKKNGVTEGSVSKRILHAATEEELNLGNLQKEREKEILIRSRAIAKSLNLDMKLCEVEVQADSRKATFYYTADQRVDFRELIKLYAGEFKLKVEMKQIGARQETAKVGGIGSCGRELCCSTWLTDFKSVNTNSARYQNLALNQSKLSGQCGRLKCCLNYELDTYMDALSVFPDDADVLEAERGNATLQKKDIFKNLMWYSFSDNNKQYPLSIERVREIKKLNKSGQKVAELQPVEIETHVSKNASQPEAGFVNDVGQLTLKSLEKGNKKKKNNSNSGNRNGQQGGNPNQPNRQPQNAKPSGNQPRKPDEQRQNQPSNRPQPRNDQPRSGQGQGQNQQRPNQPKQGQGEGQRQRTNQPKQEQGEAPLQGTDQPIEGQDEGQQTLGSQPKQGQGQGPQRRNFGNNNPKPEHRNNSGNNPNRQNNPNNPGNTNSQKSKQDRPHRPNQSPNPVDNPNRQPRNNPRPRPENGAGVENVKKESEGSEDQQ
jgi:cell fate regulator YaaT (PSP1 superfamily)